MVEINQDLLTAVLAVLTDSVSRESLRSVLRIWSESPGCSLAELLVAQGVLDEGRVRALRCLVSAHLERHSGDLGLSVEAWNARALTEDVLTEIESAAPGSTLGETLAQNLAPTVAGESADAREPAPRPVPAGFTPEQRFELLKQHARGGIGQVWLARDRELQREVAVKEIQPRFVDREDQRKRFLLEAEITGQLEHPGIVPVYSLGRNAEGRPYYAMRFIRGERFSDAIRRFHRGDGSQPEGTAALEQRSAATWGVEFQQLLRRFLDVCDAMEYAHSRGVIHRDLKPANIMLGQYGETLVVDWGLAKIVGMTDLTAIQAGRIEAGASEAPGEDQPDAGGETQPGATAGTGGETQPGATIGTPAYMSPEQARGALEELGPASDVYSLGATLYELLTGVMPFQGRNLGEVIARVKKGELAPPRSVLTTVPAPLEAVCLKAMALKPEHRYQTARELARDLEHWLADEPVGAYPENTTQRLARWLRRHRSWAYAGAASLVGITLVATAALFVLNLARQREESARLEAEANFELAQQAVDDYLTNISENELLNQQDRLDIGILRKDLLRRALPYYEEFLRKRSGDPRLRKNLANAQYRVGEITREVASPAEALKAYDAAIKLWEQLAAEDPTNLEFSFRLAEALIAKGKLQAFIARPQDALAPLARARQILEPLVERFPSESLYQSRLARCYTETGIIQNDLELADRGYGVLVKARSIEERLIQRDPSNVEHIRSLAETINVLGRVYDTQADYPAAIQSYAEVQRLCKVLLDRPGSSTRSIRDQELLALSYYNQGNIHLRVNEGGKALRCYEQALEYAQSLTRSHPSIYTFKEKLGSIYRETAMLQHSQGQEKQAIGSVEESRKIYQELIKTDSEQAVYHSQLGLTWDMLGLLHDEAHDNAAAIEPYRQAIHEQELAIARSHGVNRFRYYLAFHLENLGEQYVDLGDAATGLPYYQRAIQIRQELNRETPDDREYALSLVSALGVLANLYRHDGAPAAALPLLEKSKEVLGRWTGAAPNDAEFQRLSIAMLGHEAAVLADLNRLDESRGVLQRAVESARAILARDPGDTSVRELLSESLWDLARISRSQGQAEDADKRERERRDLWKDQSAEDLFALAQKEARQGNLIGYGKTPIAPAATVVRKLDDDRAVAHLRLALEQGFRDTARLKADPDLALLIQRTGIGPSLPEPSPPRPGTPP